MVGSLVQSAVLPALHRSRAQWRRSTKTYALARVSVSKLQVHSCPLRSSGSRTPHTIFLGDGSILPGQTVRPVRKQARSVAVKAFFEKFTEKAIEVVMLAQEEARRLGHNFVGTEQILLGLIGEGSGISAKVLKSMGINLKDARVEVEKVIGKGSGFVNVEIPFTPRAKRVLELSLNEARQLGHTCIGPEHLLLGLLREGEGIAARVLETLRADPSNIRTQVIRMVEESKEYVCAGVGGGSSGQKMPSLEEYEINITEMINERTRMAWERTNLTELVEKLDPVVVRQEQIKRVIQNLESNSSKKFTEKALKVVMLAQEEARRLGHNPVGTEQILLGLIGEGTGIAAEVLKSMGMNMKDARVAVVEIIGRGTGFLSILQFPFTPRAKRVLELSLREAIQLGHNYIGSEHLLLGLLREGGGVAARVLETLGANPSNIRTQVTRMALVSCPAPAGRGTRTENGIFYIQPTARQPTSQHKNKQNQVDW